MTDLRLVAVVVAAFVSAPAQAQTIYKCRTASGGTTYSGLPCAAGMSTDRVRAQDTPVQPPPAEAPAKETAQSSNARLLDAKVAEALGSGDFSRAKSLAVSVEHWRMIAEAEERVRQQTMGRPRQQVEGGSASASACSEAERSYEIEASSIRRNAPAIAAAREKMQSACRGRETKTTTQR